MQWNARKAVVLTVLVFLENVVDSILKWLWDESAPKKNMTVQYTPSLSREKEEMTYAKFLHLSHSEPL